MSITTGKLVNATDCQKIIENKRLEILQELSSLKKEEEAMLSQIKEHEATIQAEQSEVAMLTNALSVTTSSIDAQLKMKEINDNQVMCSIVDSNVDEEIIELRSDIAKTDNILRKLQTQLETESHPELVEIMSKVQKENVKQSRLCDDLEEARTAIEGISYRIAIWSFGNIVTSFYH